MNILIPMAGDGRRFSEAGYGLPKPLIDVNGKPMIRAAVESLGLCGQYLFVVRDCKELSEIKAVLRDTTNGGLAVRSIDYLTEGAACTCLLMEDFINNDIPLVITNCDQVMKWDAAAFLEFVKNGDFDGAVVTYKKITPKNSYVRLGPDGFAVEFAEKKIISDQSLNGIHYWRKGSDFVRSAKEMIRKNLRTNNEFYIAPTYNELVFEGKKIVAYEIPLDQHFAIGVPEDLQLYLEYEKKHANP